MNQTRKDVLNGWKEIAAYLGRDSRTVERWEKQRFLPVRRLPGSGRATVYALRSELDEWLASSPLREPEVAVLPEAVPALETAASSPQVNPSAPVPEEVPVDLGLANSGRRFTSRAGRWALIAALIALVGGAGLAGTGWRRSHGRLPANGGETSDVSRLRKLVPSSPVFGVEELYLRGCYQAELRTPDSLHRAQDAFTAAIAKDPKYAPAFAGLASSYILLREYSTLPDSEAYPKAKDAAREALILNPELPQAHASMGFVDFFWNWDEVAAEKEFQEALKLDPSLALAHHWYGSVLTHEGRFREALAQLEVAQRLDPSSPAILTMRAFALGMSGRRAEGSDMLQEAINSDKTGQYRNPATMHHVLGILSLLPPRDIPRYLSETLLGAELRLDQPTVEAMQVASGIYKSSGELAMWRGLLALERKRHPGGGRTYTMARIEAELGEKDQALNDLADLFSRHDTELIGISVDPLFVGLRKEPRFLQLRAAMGLPRVDAS